MFNYRTDYHQNLNLKVLVKIGFLTGRVYSIVLSQCLYILQKLAKCRLVQNIPHVVSETSVVQGQSN